MAEREGFEPPVPCGTPDFESGALVRFAQGYALDLTVALGSALDYHRLQERVPIAAIDLRFITVGVAQERVHPGRNVPVSRAGEAGIVAPSLDILSKLGRGDKTQSVCGRAVNDVRIRPHAARGRDGQEQPQAVGVFHVGGVLVCNPVERDPTPAQLGRPIGVVGRRGGDTRLVTRRAVRVFRYPPSVINIEGRVLDDETRLAGTPSFGGNRKFDEWHGGSAPALAVPLLEWSRGRLGTRHKNAISIAGLVVHA